jgi:drug/metabolite transporter (DMT)-like permease
MLHRKINPRSRYLIVVLALVLSTAQVQGATAEGSKTTTVSNATAAYKALALATAILASTTAALARANNTTFAAIKTLKSATIAKLSPTSEPR